MKLFLTSVAALTLEKIVPLLPKKPQNSTVLFIPTASDPYKTKPWVEEDRKKLIELGFNLIDFNVTGKSKNQVLEVTKNIDIVFVAGGNTFYLLEKVKKSGFDSVLKDLVSNGIVYIGSSAGSVIAGPDIRPVEIFDDPNEAELSDTSALGLVDFVVLPHYKKEKYGHYHDKVIEKYSNDFELILIIDDQIIVVENKTYRVM